MGLELGWQGASFQGRHVQVLRLDYQGGVAQLCRGLLHLALEIVAETFRSSMKVSLSNSLHFRLTLKIVAEFYLHVFRIRFMRGNYIKHFVQ